MPRPAARLVLGAVLAVLCAARLAYAADVLVAQGATWKYKDDGSDQGTAWRAGGFNDGAWTPGPAQLGYGDGDEATVVSYGPNASAKYTTTYFRKTFSVASPGAYTSLQMRLLRDDGAVVYLNGVEVRRDNMPTGPITYTTLASTALGTPDEATFFTSTVAASALVAGTNTIAVEVHQANGTSTDLSFDLELTGLTGASVTRGPYLQLGTPSSIHVRWRTDAATDSRVRYGTDSANLNLVADDALSVTEHEVTLTGLTANTTYYYSVGTLVATLASSPDQVFTTSPTAAKPTRIWVIGDAGTGTASQAQVRDSFLAYTGTRTPDLWLMLGDNAYDAGTDAEYQAKVFNVYAKTFKQSVAWPAVGNHDTNQSTSFDPSIAYYQSFTLPKSAEAGGAVSGTEAYYSFDYGNVHLVALDSMTSDRSATGPMATWLKADLGQTTKEWVIVYWHHPPYSKGSHDSDTDLQMSQMRQNILPILDSYGVDLVLSGHSHAYERSFLIDGHYGTSATWNPATMLKQGGSGQDPVPYAKATAGLGPHEGAVYTVAGSSGQTSGGTLNHPVMHKSLNVLGSMVIDVDGNRLDARFLRESATPGVPGNVDDSFTIVKPNTPPTVSIMSPAAGATFGGPVPIVVAASAADADGTVARVDFFANGAPIGSATAAPYAVTWSNMAAKSYGLLAVATDDDGASTSSAEVFITVSPQGTPIPDAPSGLEATPLSRSSVRVDWSDRATNEDRYSVERSRDGLTWTVVAPSLAANTTTYTSSGLLKNSTYYFRVRAANAAGESAYSNTASAKTPKK